MERRDRRRGEKEGDRRGEHRKLNGRPRDPSGLQDDTIHSSTAAAGTPRGRNQRLAPLTLSLSGLVEVLKLEDVTITAPAAQWEIRKHKCKIISLSPRGGRGGIRSRNDLLLNRES